jgi:hypothetical protein
MHSNRRSSRLDLIKFSMLVIHTLLGECRNVALAITSFEPNLFSLISDKARRKNVLTVQKRLAMNELGSLDIAACRALSAVLAFGINRFPAIRPQFGRRKQGIIALD